MPRTGASASRSADRCGRVAVCGAFWRRCVACGTAGGAATPVARLRRRLWARGRNRREKWGHSPFWPRAGAEKGECPRFLPVSLSLISHTNVGKTTLARTLLRRDVGEVRDAAHVTETADALMLIETPQGDALRALGHAGLRRQRAPARSACGRAAIRSAGFSRRSGTATSTDPSSAASRRSATCATRPTSCSTSSTRARHPAAAGYVDAEMQILGWIGKPVTRAAEPARSATTSGCRGADVRRWCGAPRRLFVGPRHARLRRVRALLGAGASAARADRRRAARRAARGVRAPGDAWKDRNRQVFEAVDADTRRAHLAATATDGVAATAGSVGTAARSWLTAAGLG